MCGLCALNSGQWGLSHTKTMSISVSIKHWCSEAHRNTAVFGEQPDLLPRLLSRRTWDRTWTPAVSGHRLTDPWHTPCSMEFVRRLFCDSFSIAETEKLLIWSTEGRSWTMKCDLCDFEVICHVLLVPVFWNWHCSPEVQISYGTRRFTAELATSSHLLLSCIHYCFSKADGDRTSLTSVNTGFHTKSRRKDVALHTHRPSSEAES
jgi:hypothetical protein